jgi:drug/metabolite transporter (DMT)-like permease
MGFGRRSFRIVPRRDLVLLAVCGLALAAHWTMFFKAVQVSSVAIGLLAYASFPVFTVFLEPFLTKERWDPASLVFALLCVLGIGLIIPRFDLGDAVVRGVLWGLGAGLTFSVLSVLNRVLASRQSSLAVAFCRSSSGPTSPSRGATGRSSPSSAFSSRPGPTPCSSTE